MWPARWYLQRRWGGFVITAREGRYGETVAAGTHDAVLAALRLLNPPTPGVNGWREFKWPVRNS